MASEQEQSTYVLVVEDEMVLRMKAVDMVEDAGFVPIEAVNADEAIRILESRPDISLLFTDIQMPGKMDGLKLAHAVHRRWPEIKIVLVSGQIVVTDEDKPAESRFFSKPLTSDKMIAELQEMIGTGVLKLGTTAEPDREMSLEELSSENRHLRILLAQAGVDAKVLSEKATDDAERHEANDKRQKQIIKRGDATEKRQTRIIQEMQPEQDALTAANESLRLSLEQAGIDANTLLIQAGIDAKEREAAGKLQKLIHEELHHRIKNTLATVSAIASQSLRTAPSMEHCKKAIEGRLEALGRAHDLLMRGSWDNAFLAQTVQSATTPYDSGGTGRISISGPDVRITSGSVIALAMTLNELCTNTTKFGALSVPEGRVKVSWTDDEDRLKLTWTESGGPTVSQPDRRSFGTRMMLSLGHQLQGQVDLAYEAGGFIYSLDVPLTSLTQKPQRS
jgi:two-component sensor histidine kinase